MPLLFLLRVTFVDFPKVPPFGSPATVSLSTANKTQSQKKKKRKEGVQWCSPKAKKLHTRAETAELRKYNQESKNPKETEEESKRQNEKDVKLMLSRRI